MFKKPMYIWTGTAGAAAGAVTITSDRTPREGDRVTCVRDVTTNADCSASFESVITVEGQIQQTATTNVTTSSGPLVIFAERK